MVAPFQQRENIDFRQKGFRCIDRVLGEGVRAIGDVVSDAVTFAEPKNKEPVGGANSGDGLLLLPCGKALRIPFSTATSLA
jgi:hypothetical protein